MTNSLMGLASPSTLKSSPRVLFLFPSQIVSLAISSVDFSVKASGVIHSASTGALNTRLGCSVIVIFYTSALVDTGAETAK